MAEDVGVDVQPGPSLLGVEREHDAASLVGVERPEEGLCRVSYGSGAHAGGGQTERRPGSFRRC